MQWPVLKQWSMKFIVTPSLMGIFFGLGFFLTFLFFRYEGFAKMETKLNNFISELL